MELDGKVWKWAKIACYVLAGITTFDALRRYVQAPGEWQHPVDWTLALNASERASWMQAWGTLIAIAAAIAIGIFQARENRKLVRAERKLARDEEHARQAAAAAEDHARKRTTALWLGMRLVNLARLAERTVRCWDAWKTTLASGPLNQAAMDSLLLAQDGLRLQGTTELRDMLASLGLTNDAGFNVVGAIECMRDYSDTTETTLNVIRIQKGTSKPVELAIERQKQRLAEVEQRCYVAYTHIASSFGLRPLNEVLAEPYVATQASETP